MQLQKIPEGAAALPRRLRRHVRQPTWLHRRVGTDVDDAFLRAVPVDALRRVVDGLPLLERRLVWLLRQEPSLSTETIAAYLGVRPATVSTMRAGVVPRVRARLRAFGFVAA